MVTLHDLAILTTLNDIRVDRTLHQKIRLDLIRLILKDTDKLLTDRLAL